MIYSQKKDNRGASRAMAGSNEIKALIDYLLFGGLRRRKRPTDREWSALPLLSIQSEQIAEHFGDAFWPSEIVRLSPSGESDELLATALEQPLAVYLLINSRLGSRVTPPFRGEGPGKFALMDALRRSGYRPQLERWVRLAGVAARKTTDVSTALSGYDNLSAAAPKKCAKPLERFFPLHHLVFRRKSPGSEARGEAGAFTIMLLKGGYGYEV
jgi:hypothetical protein